MHKLNDLTHLMKEPDKFRRSFDLFHLETVQAREDHAPLKQGWVVVLR
jgi:hypothetical protein